jgi:hypothetical protein
MNYPRSSQTHPSIWILMTVAGVGGALLLGLTTVSQLATQLAAAGTVSVTMATVSRISRRGRSPENSLVAPRRPRQPPDPDDARSS